MRARRGEDTGLTSERGPGAALPFGRVSGAAERIFRHCSSKLFGLFSVFNARLRDNTRLLALSTQYGEHPEGPFAVVACLRCLRSQRFQQQGFLLLLSLCIYWMSVCTRGRGGTAERPWAVTARPCVPTRGQFAHNWLMLRTDIMLPPYRHEAAKCLIV